MTNFDKQLKAAIETYSELSGKTVEFIRNECMNFESATSKHVQMIMFAAR
jgi:hypothetical protein